MGRLRVERMLCSQTRVRHSKARRSSSSRVAHPSSRKVLDVRIDGAHRRPSRCFHTDVQEDDMSTPARSRVGATDRDDRGATAPRHTSRRLSTETKAAFKTTEWFAYIAVLAGILIAGALVDSSDAGGYGARQVWLYATILTVGYMLFRGLAKSGSRDPYDADDSNR